MCVFYFLLKHIIRCFYHCIHLTKRTFGDVDLNCSPVFLCYRVFCFCIKYNVLKDASMFLIVYLVFCFVHLPLRTH